MRRFGSLRVHPVPTDGRKEVGSEGHECTYCDVSIAGARCIRRRRSTGFGRANEVIERFCDRRCRGLFDERGPKWSHVDGPGSEDSEAASATAETSSASEVQA